VQIILLSHVIFRQLFLYQFFLQH